MLNKRETEGGARSAFKAPGPDTETEQSELELNFQKKDISQRNTEKYVIKIFHYEDIIRETLCQYFHDNQKIFLASSVSSSESENIFGNFLRTSVKNILRGFSFIYPRIDTF